MTPNLVIVHQALALLAVNNPVYVNCDGATKKHLEAVFEELRPTFSLEVYQCASDYYQVIITKQG